jgi:Right handed beta helix region
MKKTRLNVRWFAPLLMLTLASTAAHAQATRTWVSGVGDDVNPCSRTAPCKTFAGAISKTAAFGQINVLDPGAFGALTITKSITVDASGSFAGVLATLASSGIIVNATGTDVVILRGLTIDGANTGGNGIRVLAVGTLHIENCVINGFAQKGIDVEPTTAVQLFINNTVIRDNQNAANGGGILIKPSGAGSVKATIDGVQSERNTFGLRVESNTETTVRNSNFSGGSIGVIAAAATNGQVTISDSIIANNINGVQATTSAFSIARLSNTTISNNITTNLSTSGGGQIISFGRNRIVGVAGAFTSNAGEQ